MSTPVPTSPRRALWRVLAGFGVTAALVSGVWCAYQLLPERRDEIRAEDRADPSLDFDQPWPSGHGKAIIENGRLYDQAAVDLAGITEVVLPAERGTPPPEQRVAEQITIAVRTDGQPGVVQVLLEKRLYDFAHLPESRRLVSLREWLKVWKRQTGTVLVLDADGGGSARHGGTFVHTIFFLPPHLTVRRESVWGPWFAGRYQDGWRVQAEGRKAAGWEEVPQQPLPKTEWPLPIERPPPLNLPR